MMAPYSKKSKMKSLLASMVPLCMLLSVSSLVVLWSRKTKEVITYTENSRSLLETLDENSPALDDDTRESSKCSSYLQNFLNGTTDQQDICTAFAEAYQAADCEGGDTFLMETSSHALDHRHQAANGTWLDDDIVLDDFFESWSCCRNMRRIYGYQCQSDGKWHNSWTLLFVLIVLIACNGIKALLKFLELRWIPDACAFIIIGSIVGGLLSIFNVTRKLSFDNELFLQILLPPVLFQASLSIDKQAFKRNVFSIISFAFLGTAFSAFSIGWVVHQISLWGNGKSLPLIDSLVFGSLISSIDPVATLGILSSVGVSRSDTLYILIFGESLLNDGVSIVLFDVLKPFLGREVEIGDSDYHAMVNRFIGVLLGSICVGLACGALSTMYFYCLRGCTGAVSEVASFFCWALIPYYIADGMECSGIISIMVMGFTSDYFVIGGLRSEEVAQMDYMTLRSDNEHGRNHLPTSNSYDNLSMFMSNAFSGRGHILARSRHHVSFVAELLSETFETAIFAYLGLFLFSDSSWNTRLNLTGVFGCIVSRIGMVVLLSLGINIAVFFDCSRHLSRHFKRIYRTLSNRHEYNMNVQIDEDTMGISQERSFLDHRTQLILVLSGIRGAVSFALVENIPVYNSVAKVGSQFKPELKAMTSSSIVFTLFVFGALTYFTVENNPTNRSGNQSMEWLSHERSRELLNNDGYTSELTPSTNLSIPPQEEEDAAAGVFNIESQDRQRVVPLLSEYNEPRNEAPLE